MNTRRAAAVALTLLLVGGWPDIQVRQDGNQASDEVATAQARAAQATPSGAREVSGRKWSSGVRDLAPGPTEWSARRHGLVTLIEMCSSASRPSAPPLVLRI